MPSIVKTLVSKNLIKPPHSVREGLQYETIMGSEAYGVSTDSSDRDIYGFCIPAKEDIFPHLKGEIFGFGRQVQRFDVWQEHHVIDKDNSKEYDLSIYSIVRYFMLLMENNPNIIDSIFTPRRCVTFSTKIGEMVRENRNIFLHKGAWFKFKGYAFSQLHKLNTKDPIGKRKETIEKYGYDVKFAYHLVRLLNEVEQILIEGDLCLERNNEQLKSIRGGEWTPKQIEEYFFSKEKSLEDVYTKSILRHVPDEDAIKKLLLSCLEEYYGSLKACIVTEDKAIQALKDIQKIIERATK